MALTGTGEVLSPRNETVEQEIFYPHFDCRIFMQAAAIFGEPRWFDLRDVKIFRLPTPGASHLKIKWR